MLKRNEIKGYEMSSCCQNLTVTFFKDLRKFFCSGKENKDGDE
jgi:hypothetical protein